MFASIRLFAGIVALAGLSFALAEGVLAASCAPTEIEASVVEETSHGHDHGPSCPFAPLASPDGCAAAASLPAVAGSELMFSPEVSESIGWSQTQTELLLATALFRPPRA